MESYCVFLMGAFVAYTYFMDKFGVVDKTGNKAIQASWQSALQMGGPLGALVGVLIAGPITSRIGYRWATIGGLMCLNAFIFIFYFANSLAVMFVAQLLEGVPWGIFIANAPAYCSEIVPIKLRAPATQMLQMFWAIGSIIVGGITYALQGRDNETCYRSAFSMPPLLFWVPPSPSRGYVKLVLDIDESPGFPLPSSGCFRRLSQSSSTWLPSLLGGWFVKDVLTRRPSRFDDWGARQWLSISTSPLP